MGYSTIKESASAEFVEKKSRFIGYIAPVKTAEDAASFIAEIKRKHWDATHNVSAYLLKNGQKKYSDDGEPQGTAGMPMLDVLEKENLTDVCVVGTRYFGGILLGGGGLVRAYSHTAKIAVDAAQILNMVECKVLSVTVDYGLYNKLLYVLPEYDIKVLSSDYGAEIVLKLLIKEERYPAFEKIFREMTNGQRTIQVLEEAFDFF